MNKRNRYVGKYFYEVRPASSKNLSTGEFLVNGPLSTIRYISKTNVRRLRKADKIKLFGGQATLNGTIKFKYVQVVKGVITALFTKDEILVTTKPLFGHTTPIDQEIS